MTLYFAPSSPYTAYLPSVTLQTLNGIKERMKDGSLLSSHNSVLALEFLDSSYSLAPIMPMEASEIDTETAALSRGNGGLAAGLIIFFLVLSGILGYFGWRKYKEFIQSNDAPEHESDVSVEIHDDGNVKESRSDDDDGEESYTSSGSESSSRGSIHTNEDTGDDGGSYSESASDTDSDGIFEDDDSIDLEDLSSEYAMYRKNKVPKTKNNIVMNGMAEDASIATGATGLHSEASQRTVKMKNVVLPNILDVDINLR